MKEHLSGRQNLLTPALNDADEHFRPFSTTTRNCEMFAAFHLQALDSSFTKAHRDSWGLKAGGSGGPR